MNQQTIFQTCTVATLDHNSSDTSADILECISERLQSIGKDGSSSSMADWRRYLLLLSGMLVFLMQAGFAMLLAGAVRQKNVQNAMLKNLLDACGTAIAFYCVGYAFAFGGQDVNDDTTFIGNNNFFNMGEINFGFWFFHYTISTAAVTIVAGTIAERCQMVAYVFYSIFLAGFVYPVVAHAIWTRNGFLSATNVDPILGVGMVDFAGAGVVHLTGGASALYAAVILGPRRGRFHNASTGEILSKPTVFKGHSIALQVLGTFCLWFGWIGFNSGSALLLYQKKYSSEIALMASVNTCLSAAAAGLTSLLSHALWVKLHKFEYNFSLVHMMNGCLSGLVAITAGCGVVQNWAAFLIGFVSGLIYPLSSCLLIRLRIDDCVDAIPVHMFSSCWGLLATGLFASPDLMLKAYGTTKSGWFYSLGQGPAAGASILACEVVGIIFILGWTFVTMVPFFLGLEFVGWFRTKASDEMKGLDLLYHGDENNSEAEEADDLVKEEYMDAFSNYRARVLQRKGREAQRQELAGSQSPDNSRSNSNDRRSSKASSKISLSTNTSHAPSKILQSLIDEKDSLLDP